MDKLAHIQILDDTGKDFGCRAADIKRYRETTGGCIVFFDDGTSVASTNTVTQVQALVDGLWGEYITALGDPA